MRHGRKTNSLGRTASHRRAMLSNMASSLILSKRIKTTLAKAKALRKYVEPLLTRAKEDTTHGRRIVFSHLSNKYSVAELFDNISKKITERPGGYTRILRLGERQGDKAQVCLIELVDYNDTYQKRSRTGKGSKDSRRSRRGTGRKKREQQEAAVSEIKTPSITPSAKKEDVPRDGSGTDSEKKTPSDSSSS
ncbi:MAG: 50S ribosomal protein L17 [Cytophagales bacterium]|nr:50S ribosomal protein L17 [Cytophagales bacterium]